MINSVCGIRSTGRICTDLADSLINEGHDVVIAYGREFVPEQYRPYAKKITSEIGSGMHALLSRFTDRSGFYNTASTKKFVQWIKEYDPEIIHLHNLHGYYLDIKILFDYINNCGKRIIWTLHDCWAFTGHCSYFDVVGCDKWKEICFNCPQKKRYPKSILLDQSKRNYLEKKELFSSKKDMVIVTPSQWLADLVKKSYLGTFETKVIHNGIATDEFQFRESDFRRKYNLQDKTIILGVSSIWDKLKGLDDFILLTKKLSKEKQIVLVGVTAEQIKSLPKEIIGIERTNNIRELAEIYSAADVFVNPTYEDNYPTVNLEAQACGLPVITYKTGGSIESVPQKYWVTQGDIDELVKVINAVVDSDKADLAAVTDKRQFVSEYLKLYI